MRACWETMSRKLLEMTKGRKMTKGCKKRHMGNSEKMPREEINLNKKKKKKTLIIM
jgi:hypothetical protein